MDLIFTLKDQGSVVATIQRLAGVNLASDVTYYTKRTVDSASAASVSIDLVTEAALLGVTSQITFIVVYERPISSSTSYVFRTRLNGGTGTSADWFVLCNQSVAPTQLVIDSLTVPPANLSATLHVWIIGTN